MKPGPIARGVMRAEKLQRLAEEDSASSQPSMPVDFPSRWSLYAHLHLPDFAVSERHLAFTRQIDQRIRGGSAVLGVHTGDVALLRLIADREAACAA